MQRFATLAAAALAAASLTAVGADATAPEAEGPKQEKKICRTSKATGSLTRRTRICRTEAEWRELNDRTRQGLQGLQGSASGAPTCISAIDVSCTPAAAAPQGGIGPGGF